MRLHKSPFAIVNTSDEIVFRGEAATADRVTIKQAMNQYHKACADFNIEPQDVAELRVMAFSPLKIWSRRIDR